MATKILTPNASAWAQAFKNLHAQGVISTEQMDLSLQRIERTGGVKNSIAGQFQESFLCPICRKYHSVENRGSRRPKWCIGCEDELIGDMMF